MWSFNDYRPGKVNTWILFALMYCLNSSLVTSDLNLSDLTFPFCSFNVWQYSLALVNRSSCSIFSFLKSNRFWAAFDSLLNYSMSLSFFPVDFKPRFFCNVLAIGDLNWFWDICDYYLIGLIIKVSWLSAKADSWSF